MIKPTRIKISRLGRNPENWQFWVYFDTQLLVELRPALARELVYELASYTGLAVSPAESWTSRARHAVRGVPGRMRSLFRRRSAHARR
ncbi:hypothetical protein CTZ27_26390 [Streptomyces griseocarneus]|nr:hypothetical protein CTZ27_26390 [Streptomyces griseocarneus]